jgi:hypothetical protein
MLITVNTTTELYRNLDVNDDVTNWWTDQAAGGELGLAHAPSHSRSSCLVVDTIWWCWRSRWVPPAGCEVSLDALKLLPSAVRADGPWCQAGTDGQTEYSIGGGLLVVGVWWPRARGRSREPQRIAARRGFTCARIVSRQRRRVWGVATSQIFFLLVRSPPGPGQCNMQED